MNVITLAVALVLASGPQPPDSSLVLMTRQLNFRDAWSRTIEGYTDSTLTSHIAVQADTTMPMPATSLVAASSFRVSQPSPIRLVLAPVWLAFFNNDVSRMSRATMIMEKSTDGRSWSSAKRVELVVDANAAVAEFDMQPWAGFFVRWIVKSDLSGHYGIRATYLNTKEQLVNRYR